MRVPALPADPDHPAARAAHHGLPHPPEAQKAEKLWQARESQIEQMTLEELENELRRRQKEEANSSSSKDDG